MKAIFGAHSVRNNLGISIFALILAICCPVLSAAQELAYPLSIRTRYEAVDPKAGGHFTIWLDRETVRLGIDSRHFPAVSYVEVAHVTPSQGSPMMTFIEVMPVNGNTPEFYHVAGLVRFKVAGMKPTSTNRPSQQ